MRHLPTFILLYCFQTAIAQFQDDFSDGDFTHNPPWTGDTAHFNTVNYELRLNAPPVTDTSILIVESQVGLQATWNFKVSLDFNPSSSNLLRVYLMSDKSALKESCHGYYISIGGSQDDVSLYRQDGDNEILLVDGKDGALNSASVNLRIMVVRDSLHNWLLYRDTLGFNDFLQEGTAVDNTYQLSSFFGFFCKYTSTRADKFTFDDISVTGKVFIDESKPVITSSSIISPNIWEIGTSEDIDSTTMLTSNFTFSDPEIESINIEYDKASNLIQIRTNQNFGHGKTVTMLVQGLKDLSGNQITDSLLTDFYTFQDSISAKEILLNEVMFDPEPSSGLPPAEYLELHNKTGNFLRLNGWKISDVRDTVVIPTAILNPGGFLLLTDISDETAWLESGFESISLQLPSLNNDKDTLILISQMGEIIDSMNYSQSQIGGGENDVAVSLELVNPDFLCTDSTNWKRSIAPNGGSPGQKNSRISHSHNTEPPKIESLNWLGDSVLEITLTGFPDINQSFRQLVRLQPEIPVISTSLAHSRDLIVELNGHLQQNQFYKVTIDDIRSCFPLDHVSLDSKFVFPARADAGDLVINEILFNPDEGGSDFIEILNISQDYLDLSEINIGNSQNDTMANLKSLSILKDIIAPGEYRAFTEDSLYIVNSYPTCGPLFLREIDLPSYNDDGGDVYLLAPSGEVIDQFHYDETMHFPLIENVEGISLERISPFSSSIQTTNWTSSSSSSGYGTPGLPNSQLVTGIGNQFSLIPDIFSPDNDGYNDVVMISYHLSQAGHYGSIKIYDEGGKLIINLIENEILGSGGFFLWNGFNSRNQKAPVGFYLVVFEYIGLRGEMKKEAATLVLAHWMK